MSDFDLEIYVICIAVPDECSNMPLFRPRESSKNFLVNFFFSWALRLAVSPALICKNNSI